MKTEKENQLLDRKEQYSINTFHFKGPGTGNRKNVSETDTKRRRTAKRA